MMTMTANVRRRGVTIVEILIAAGILSVLIVGVMNLFAVTQKQAVSSEALLNSGTLAQLVIERIKSNVSQNPRYLRDLMAGNPTWSFTGTVVEPARATNPSLQLSPFFQYLFTREAAELCQPGNQVTLGPAAGAGASGTGIRAPELNALFETFRDSEVKVEIANDDAPLGSPLAPGPNPESVKRITVTVSRASVTASGGKDPLAFTVTSRVATPAESLSDAAFDELAATFDAPPLQAQWDEYMDVTGSENPYLDVSVLGDESKKVVADAFIILSRANHESLLVAGRTITGTEVLPPPDAADKFMDPWITELSVGGVANLSSSRREIARLRGRKAGVIFDAFKTVHLPMAHFITAILGPRVTPVPLRDKVASVTALIQGMLAQIAQMEAAVNAGTAAYSAAEAAVAIADPGVPGSVASAVGALSDAQSTLTNLSNQLTSFSSSAVTLVTAERETVVLVSLLIQFFTDPAYKDTAARPGDYSTRFKTTIDEMAATIEAHLAAPDATPYERMAAAKLYYEVTCARQLEMDGPDATATARLKAEATAAASRMGEFARYVGGGEAHDFARLKLRNKRFAERVKALKLLSPQYKQIVAYFQLGGPADQMVKAYEQFGGKMSLDPKSILGALTKLMEKIKKK